MLRTHPHAGKTGAIVEQPSDGDIPMYRIDFDGLYEGGAYAERHDLEVIDQ
jgi:hypothetical protein